MEPFLAHIVQRSSAPSPALTPRLAGRYEDTRAPAGSVAGSEDAVAAVHAALAPSARHGEAASSDSAGSSGQPGESAPGVPRQDDTGPASPAQAAPSGQAMPALRAERSEVSGPPARESSTPPRPRYAAVTQPAHAREAWADLPPGGGSRAGASAAHRAPRMVAGEPRPDPMAPAGTPLDPPALWRGEGEAGAPADRLFVAPSVKTPPGRQSVPQAGALTEPPRRAALSEPQRAAAPMQTQAAQPVLVTIGRVELRAAAPAAAAPARPRAAPVRPELSLGDYLQRRDQPEGRR